MKETEYKTSTTTIHVIDENIFHNYVHEHATVSIEDILEVKNLNTKLAKGKPYALLVSKGEFSIIAPKVRELISSEAFVGNTIAKALLMSSIADKIIAQFYLKINKPSIKTKLFTNKKKAVIWLKSELENNSGKPSKKATKTQVTV